MPISQDFSDLLQCLNEKSVRYLLVGAHAVAYYSEPRYTKDIDIWVDPDPDNAKNVYEALEKFGAPLESLKIEDLTNPEMVFQIGVEPVRIDILMGIGNIEFSSAWENREETTFGDAKVYIIGINELTEAKKSSTRPKDKLDLDKLKK